MRLAEIFPSDSLIAKFEKSISINVRNRNKLPEISKLKASCMTEIGGGAWDKYVQKNPECDSQALAPYFMESSPKIYLAMERHTGLRVLNDICYITVEIQDDTLEDKQCAELLLAVTWPDVLRISDVTFANPYKQIPDSARKYRFQIFKGLGLFGELLEKCEKYCRTNNISEITLAAAYIDLVPFFESYGFAVDDTPAGKASLEYKEGIPMHKLI